VALLEEQNLTREPDLVPVRHGRMMISPFTFYRGAAKIMAADLKDTPVAGLGAQLCGDAHLSNFGAFASPERRLLFDLNDFDETLPGPFEYDVKRRARLVPLVADGVVPNGCSGVVNVRGSGSPGPRRRLRALPSAPAAGPAKSSLVPCPALRVRGVTRELGTWGVRWRLIVAACRGGG
jgi:hypothetical protein